MYPIPARLIACSRHHPTLGIVPYCNRFTFQFRVVTLLDSSKKLVHVHMNDLHSDFRRLFPALQNYEYFVDGMNAKP
jgi:hypothetical protein